MKLRHKESGSKVEHSELVTTATGWQRPYAFDRDIVVTYPFSKWERVPEERWVDVTSECVVKRDDTFNPPCWGIWHGEHDVTARYKANQNYRISKSGSYLKVERKEVS